jgi:hypothetical protein
MKPTVAADHSGGVVGMGQRFEPKYGAEEVGQWPSRDKRGRVELSWSSAFRIAWAFLIVNIFVAAIGFLLAVTVASSLLHSIH